MSENDLRQLQRLGIDIWVSPQRASELIAAGEASSLLKPEGSKFSRSETVRSSSARSWTRHASSEPAKLKTDEVAEVRDDRASPKESESKRAPELPKTPAKPFTVQIRVFLYGSVAMMIEYSSQCPNQLIRDILRALSGFEEHQVNELHFKFPLINRSKSESTIATLEGAQEGFRAWIEQRAPHCESVLVVGMPAKETAARLNERISHTIYIDELPLSRSGKQQLWNQIKNLNV